MKDKASLLFSHYVIDGERMENTPFSALYDCLDGNGTVEVPQGPFDDIVDDTADRVPAGCSYTLSLADNYVQRILSAAYDRKTVNLRYPAQWTRAAIDRLLLECLFKEGRFTLQDIMLVARWNWNAEGHGAAAAFYSSAQAAGEYLFDLGVKLDRYFVEQTGRSCNLEFSVVSKAVSSRRKCPDQMIPCSSDWLIYIPFDSARHGLGGSALSVVAGNGSGADTEYQDADYFIDCYEVVRELTEDGVIKAGVPVGYGGLACAAEKFRGRRGCSLEIGSLAAIESDENAEVRFVRALFAEKPGVLVQISDVDYDYVDSQLLLQEIAYFPLGHPSDSLKSVQICTKGRNDIANILENLLNQASEGED